LLTGLLLVPMTINYVNPTRYGIWITVFSIVSWLTFLDAGLGNGLKNKFAEALALNDHVKARIYVSTTYGILALIVSAVLILFTVVNPFLNWSGLLNAPQSLRDELNFVVLIVIALFCIRFVLQLIGIILTADQKPAYNNLFSLLSNLISLAVIYVLTLISRGSLLYLALAVSLAPIAVYAAASFYFFRGSYKKFRPSLRYVKFKYSGELMNLGFRFFIIQISSIVLFTTDSLIITHLFGPAEVTNYNIAFRYFSIFVLMFTIIAAPFWPAFTEAYIKQDFIWIKKVVNKLAALWLAMIALIIIAVAAAPLVYRLWIGEEIQIPVLLSVNMGIYTVVYTWTYIFVTFLNGIGKIKLQYMNSILITVINIPLSILLAKSFGLNSAGVILATSICVGIGAVWTPIQYLKIMRGTAKGLWNK